ncbi:hypothetical protein C8R47DRAFT_1219045 [Mycena vitilis]|nr:hypothetical protein C8R47DRAFT_1219045 [Mycena vitilis]
MSFTLSGAHFQGGTFNNIAGDMKVVNSVSGSDYGPSLPHRIDRHPYRAGALRTPRDTARHREKPYNTLRPQTQGRGFIDNHGGLSAVPIHSNSIYNAVGGNMTNVSLTSYGENGLDILFRRVLEDAMHDSAERPAEPCCHPGTRNSVLDTLRGWSQDQVKLLWLHGCAGIGKSAIAQTFAANCQEDGILGASFFFRRDDAGRGHWKGFFPTLAYQLAAKFPELRDALQHIVEDDRLVFGQAISLQFKKLILAPFEQTPPLAVKPIIVIDGLDECDDHVVQVTLLNLIIEGLRTGAFPVRVMIASRPEPHLRELLQASTNFDVCRHLQLLPDPSAYHDIHRYLCDEFSRIRDCHTSRGVPLEGGWPGEDAINHLVQKSSGTFIYAVTVVRYVDEEHSHPAERLESVLALDPQSTTPLDSLYTRILSIVPDRTVLRRVLHVVVRTRSFDPEETDAALQVRPGISRSVLRGLHSLFSVPPVRNIGFRHPVILLHASLGDFLQDRARSSDLCVATPELDFGLARSMIAFLSSSPDSILVRQVAIPCFCSTQLTVPRVMSLELLSIIPRISPANCLLPTLYHVDVQHAALGWMHISRIVDWLKNCSPTPSNLIQIWEDLSFIDAFLYSVRPEDHLENNPGTVYDDLYTQILSQNPQVLSFLRVSSVLPYMEEFNILGLKWDILRPLAALRPYHSTSGTLKQSILDFLGDPRRAGTLYADPHDIYQFTALLCISYIRRSSTNFILHIPHQWQDIIIHCPFSASVLHELEDLDIAQLCTCLRPDAQYHLIVDWLQRFPSPSLRVIEFWERQLASVEACEQNLLNGYPV